MQSWINPNLDQPEPNGGERDQGLARVPTRASAPQERGPFSIRLGASLELLQPVFPDFPVQRRSADPQHLRRYRAIAVGIYQRPFDGLALHLSHRDRRARFLRGHCTARGQTDRHRHALQSLRAQMILYRGRQSADVQQGAAVQRHHVLHTVLQFPHVARPVV